MSKLSQFHFVEISFSSEKRMSSTLSYQKVALILSCNYSGENRLYGCVNDGLHIKDFLINKRGFEPSNVTTVFDKQMTLKGMWSALDNFSAKSHAIAVSGKIPAMVLYYSGHGIRLPAKKGATEDADGDECLVPYDFQSGKFVVDDELFSRFIKRIHPKTQLFLFSDCCYSGTNFDLAYNDRSRKYRNNDVMADIVGLSGCRDDQTSAEIGGAGVATDRFLSVIGPAVNTMRKFREQMGDVGISGHPQNPQVSVSKASLVDANLFPWLVQNTGGTQLPNNTLKKEVNKFKRSLFFRKLGEAVQQLFRNASK